MQLPPPDSLQSGKDNLRKRLQRALQEMEDERQKSYDQLIKVLEQDARHQIVHIETYGVVRHSDHGIMAGRNGDLQGVSHANAITSYISALEACVRLLREVLGESERPTPRQTPAKSDTAASAGGPSARPRKKKAKAQKGAGK